jgi:trk system potassium uptake protein
MDKKQTGQADAAVELLNLSDGAPLKIIVVGCGRVGSELAFRLSQNGQIVAVVDCSISSFDNLPAGFRGRTVEGDGLSQDTLRRAGIENADAVAVVTNSDSLNAVIAHVARTAFKIQNVVVRNYDTNWRPLHEAFDLQAVAPSSWGAQRIEALLYHISARPIFAAGNGEVGIYEFMVPEEWDGKVLGEIICHEPCIPVAVTRAGKAFLPSAKARIEKGDLLLLSTTNTGISDLCQRLHLKVQA